MHIDTAEQIKHFLICESKCEESEYSINPLAKDTVADFHHEWVDRKPIVGAFWIENSQKQELFLFLIDWNEENDYYIILFNKNRKRPFAEIHKTTGNENDETLHWKYSPRKRDKQNRERKEKFKDIMGDTEVQIKVPKSVRDIPYFLKNLFLIQNSRKLVEIEEIYKDNEGKIYSEEGERLYTNKNGELVRKVGQTK